ncbi:MAG: hypothetical protein PHO20_00020 [Candidatus Peribacteraceae bacterium]|nr:hypothetical protein [Candidatus Peribacteraceae bacterium]MDD5739143.1 hypothetical protein [Candidatus Peribacteraceae bacterium]
MTPQTTGLIIGGLLPALLYGASAIFQRGSTGIGIGIGPFMIAAGIAVLLTGTALLWLDLGREWSVRSALLAMGSGAAWGIGTSLVAVALVRYGIPLGKLVPLYSMNSLIAVTLALWIFAEWKQVKVPQLLIGSILIVIGGTLVARA